MEKWIVAFLIHGMLGAQVKPFAQNLGESKAHYEQLNYQVAQQRSRELLQWVQAHQIEVDQVQIITDRLNRLAQCLEAIASRTINGSINRELRQEARLLRRAAQNLVAPLDDLRLTSPVRRYPSWHRSPQ